MGDIPIFVAADSSDVWCNQDKFKLNPDGTAKVVAGVPPDYFSKTGQRWGNPIYDWEAMLADGFAWWISRFRSTFEMVDVARVDHFRGFIGPPGKFRARTLPPKMGNGSMSLARCYSPL